MEANCPLFLQLEPMWFNVAETLPGKQQLEIILAVLFNTWTLGSTLLLTTRYNIKVKALYFFILYSK